MKKLALLFSIVALFIVVNTAKSQTLYFCEGVDANGNPSGESSTFNIPRGGGFFYFLVKLPYTVECNEVYYDIYDVYSDYSENYNTSITQDGIEKSWVWFWKKVTFYTPGYYHVYVKDCYGATLASSYLTIKFK
jgi:hypothetical protein